MLVRLNGGLKMITLPPVSFVPSPENRFCLMCRTLPLLRRACQEGGQLTVCANCVASDAFSPSVLYSASALPNDVLLLLLWGRFARDS
ncbi:hypothetical protein TYRP_001361 [Tyrophagus putrescentiae]|nr:hypothetical protein TYRP_001361 [Tyrophagus putrescentiae]